MEARSDQFERIPLPTSYISSRWKFSISVLNSASERLHAESNELEILDSVSQSRGTENNFKVVQDSPTNQFLS